VNVMRKKMIIDKEKFEKDYGLQFPNELSKLLENATPSRYEITNRQYLLEIQYFLGNEETETKDIKNNLFPFAINTDGFELLIDFGDKKMPILQREYSELDSIDVTLNELIDANVIPL